MAKRRYRASMLSGTEGTTELRCDELPLLVNPWMRACGHLGFHTVEVGLLCKPPGWTKALADETRPPLRRPTRTSSHVVLDIRKM